MILAEKPLHPRMRNHRGEEPGGDIGLQQPVPVLGEHARVPHSLVRRKPDKPAVKRVNAICSINKRSERSE